jgi:hypothetical protein
MNHLTIGNEKVTTSYSSDIGSQHHNGGHAVLPIHTRVYEAPPKPKAFANPGPLGLITVACTSFVFAMYDVHGRSVTIQNAGVGMALFVGGFTEFIAGMWDFANGNLFGATLFSAYGSFWMAYSTLWIPGFGITQAYAPHPSQYDDAVGIFLAPWFILTLIFLLACVKTNIVLVTTLSLLAMDFLTLMIANFAKSVLITKVGGVFGLCTSAFAFYLAASQLLNKDNFWFNLPLGNFHRSEHAE